MKLLLISSALLTLTIPTAADSGRRPRVFITESWSAQLTGDAAVGDAQGSLSFTGGTSPLNVEVMNTSKELLLRTLRIGE